MFKDIAWYMVYRVKDDLIRRYAKKGFQFQVSDEDKYKAVLTNSTYIWCTFFNLTYTEYAP